MHPVPLWHSGPLSVRYVGFLTLLIGAMMGGSCLGQSMPNCIGVDRFFSNEVWAKVGEKTCLRCHNLRGEAAESEFVLAANKTDIGTSYLQNRQAFEQMATRSHSEGNRLLLKVSGQLEHGGGEVLKPGSTGYAILERFVSRLQRPNNTPSTDSTSMEDDTSPFFESVEFLSPQRLLRRVTLSLVGRLPTQKEWTAVENEGPDALDALLDRIMTEEAFFVRLKEGFNDLLLTIGIEDNAETILSYEHFENSRLWYSTYDLSSLPEADQQKARWKLADVYREALLREPLELITYIVRNERPFTELVNADYIMVSPYTARGYGILDELKSKFKNADDPFEYIPAQLQALKSREGHTQESATGMYPHAGLLSTFHYLRRYPSTETNRNRLRARMFYQHFLGIDIMQLAPRSTDASAVASKFETPTMQAADCVVCHRTIDPVASAFQDFDFEGHVKRRKEGWYTDMFQAGFEGELMPESERWRAPQWLAERTIRDPRFPIAMVEHAYFLLTGRKVIQAPEDIDDAFFGARRRAYQAQREMIESVASQFAKDNFKFKGAIKAIVKSDFYRAEGVKVGELVPHRKAELDDIGIARLLSPEQLERKIGAIFGKPWGRLHDEMKILYGGIDSITVTERIADPSGAMGALQRMMANDLACGFVARDFRLDANKRTLFGGIEPDIVPGSAESDAKIVRTMIFLHRQILGLERDANHPDIIRAIQLFEGILSDAKQQSNVEPHETYFCGGREEFRAVDPLYTLRAWRGVLTYLLRQHSFLYE